MNEQRCEDCGHAIHDGGATYGDCYCSVLVITSLAAASCGCGYQTYESRGRCTKHERQEYGGPHEWGCHKPGGHDGHCSTHWDCGYVNPEDRRVCGRPPTRTGGPCDRHV